MKQIPMLFSGPMIRGLQDGSKTQTRRIVKPQPFHGRILDGVLEDEGKTYTSKFQVGDQIWCRETWKPHCDCDAEGAVTEEHPLGTCVKYQADGAMIKPTLWNDEQGFWCEAREQSTRWRPLIHMPRWASRITLEIVNVRVERLQEISEADAIAEGIESEHPLDGEPVAYRDYLLGKHDPLEWFASPIDSYKSLWESINGPGSWAKNPWVDVVEFKRLHP